MSWQKAPIITVLIMPSTTRAFARIASGVLMPGSIKITQSNSLIDKSSKTKVNYASVYATLAQSAHYGQK